MVQEGVGEDFPCCEKEGDISIVLVHRPISFPKHSHDVGIPQVLKDLLIVPNSKK